MYDTYKMMDHICKELDKKAESGLKSTTDLDTVWKLISSYKNLLRIDMLQEADSYAYDGEYGARKSNTERYSRYDESRENSRSGGNKTAKVSAGKSGYNYNSNGYEHDEDDPHERYINAKYSYRSSKSPECKQRMMATLEESMDDMRQRLQEMMRDSDCREERDIIKNYLEKFQSII